MSMSADQPNVGHSFVGGTVQSTSENTLSTLSGNIAELERSLDTEKEERLEERFRWVVVTSILFDVIAATALDSSFLFIPIFMLQLIALIAFAKAYGVDWAEQLIGQLLHRVSKWDKMSNGEGK